MAVYTKQDLKDAYYAETVTDPSTTGSDTAWWIAEVARVQDLIDARVAGLEVKKADIEVQLVERTSKIQERIDAMQSRIDNIEPDAKEYMKDIALNALAAEAEAASELDNEAVNL